MSNSEHVLEDLQKQENRKVSFIGPFTDEEIKELCEACRKIEERRPHLVFMMDVVPDSLQTMGEVKDFIKRVYPLAKGRPVDVETFVDPKVN